MSVADSDGDTALVCAARRGCAAAVAMIAEWAATKCPEALEARGVGSTPHFPVFGSSTAIFSLYTNHKTLNPKP